MLNEEFFLDKRAEEKFEVEELQNIVLNEVKGFGDEEFRNKYEEELKDRSLVEQAMIEKFRSWNKNKWTYNEGFYVNAEEFLSERPKLNGELIGGELIIEKEILERIKNKNLENKPITVLDFGGGFGVSMIRLANRFKDEIQSGKIKFIVTNLGYLPDDQADESGYFGVAKNMKKEDIGYSKEELDFIQKNQDLIKYVDSSIFELEEKIGKIDILHEKNAVVHVQTIDMALTVFGRMLKKDGLLLLSTRRVNYLQPLPERKIKVYGGGEIDTLNSDYQKFRGYSLEIGQSILKKQCTAIEKMSGRPYYFYTKRS